MLQLSSGDCLTLATLHPNGNNHTLPTALLYDERMLLRQIAGGDTGAFKTLFDSFHNRLFQYISGIVKSPQVAEELVMDVFLKLWTGRDLLIQIENFDGFLFRIAHNKTIDFLRSAARHPAFSQLLWEELQVQSDAKADTILLNHEYEAMIRHAIGLLSPQRRKVYQLSREQDLTHDEIALQLQLSKSTVNNHLVEAKQFIRHYLATQLALPMLLIIAARL